MDFSQHPSNIDQFNTSMQRLAAAIVRLPEAESLAYRQAQLQMVTSAAPSQNEFDNVCNPQRFLACEQDNADRAARRLCRYWQERKLWWCENDPNNTVVAHQVREEKLQNAWANAAALGVTLLPQPHIVPSCSVLAWDRSKMDVEDISETQLASLAQALFLLLHVVARNPTSQAEEGCILLVKTCSAAAPNTTMNTALLLLARLLRAFPIHLKAVHILAVVDPVASTTNTTTLLQHVQSWKTALQVPAHLHTATTKQDLGMLLEQQVGVLRSRLPTGLGGLWRNNHEHKHHNEPQRHSGTAMAGSVLQPQPWLPLSYNTTNMPIMDETQSPLLVAQAAFRTVPAPHHVLGTAAATSSRTLTSSLSPVQSANPFQISPPQPFTPQPPPQLLPPPLLTASEGGSTNMAMATSDNFIMRQGGLSRLQEAIQFLPHEERAAYQEALEQCPNLVQSESNPLSFLQYEGFDPWAAARRLTTYWRWRRRIFQDRAFLPISMTGDGALSAEDIVHVRRGYFSILPNDSEGRSVICYDPSRRAHHSKETRMRVGFYYWQVICENEESRRDGYVGIVLLGTSRFDPSSLDGAIRECAEMVMQSFPTRVKHMHLVQCPGRKTLLQMLLPILNYVMGRIMENRAVTHVADTAHAMMEGLAEYGLVSEGMPKVTGGKWTYDRSYVWQLERCKLERHRSRDQRRARSPISASRTRREPDPALSSTATPLVSSLCGSNVQRFRDCVNQLSGQEKASAIEAMNNHPNLVQTETSPHRFVCCHKGDIAGAARRFATYWTLRCELFGKKAFLPLTQTGEGALSRSDLTTLSSGFLSILPTTRDEPVALCYNISRQLKSDPIPILRVLFYLLQLASENVHSQSSEGVSIIVMDLLEDTKEKSPVDFEQVFDAIPVNVSHVHFVHIYGETEETESSHLDDAVTALRRKFGTIGNEKGLVQTGFNKDDLCEQLSPFGILRRRGILPKSLGGTFGFDRFVQWQELRTRFEWGLPAGVNDHDASNVYDFSDVKPLSALGPEERKERKRRMNVVHSKRKRERERIEIQVLQEQCVDLKDENRGLLRQKQRLESLVEKAGELIVGIVSGTHSPFLATPARSHSVGRRTYPTVSSRPETPGGSSPLQL